MSTARKLLFAPLLLFTSQVYGNDLSGASDAEILQRWQEIQARSGEFETRNEQFLDADLTDEERAARFEDMKMRWEAQQSLESNFREAYKDVIDAAPADGTGDVADPEQGSGGGNDIVDNGQGDAGKTSPEPAGGTAGGSVGAGDTAAPSGEIVPPAPAKQAGLTGLEFDDEFDVISLYHPDTSPSGTWRMNESWQDANLAGYVDLASLRHFDINQKTTDAKAAAIMRPYFPVSQPEKGVMRIQAMRARTNSGKWLLSEEMRTLVNDIARQQDPGIVDQVSWTGAQLTAYRFNQDKEHDFVRPAFVEWRVKWSPPDTDGYNSSLWLYTAGGNNSAEIDVFEANELSHTHFNTNLHIDNAGEQHIQNDVRWADGKWHTLGFLWTKDNFKVYWDGKESGTISNVGTFSEPMRIIMGIGGTPYYGPGYGLQVSDSINKLNLDLDYVRVWTGNNVVAKAECKPATEAEKKVFRAAAVANGSATEQEALAMNFDCAK